MTQRNTHGGIICVYAHCVTAAVHVNTIHHLYSPKWCQYHSAHCLQVRHNGILPPQLIKDNLNILSELH